MTGHRETLVLMGLGGDKVVSRQTRYINYLNTKRSKESQILIFSTLWQTDEKYPEKRARLSAFIKKHPNIKIVYGISAGASLAMSLVPEMNEDTEFHFISGKLRRPETIGEERRMRAPALYDSVVASESVISLTSFDNLIVTCHIGFLDGVLSQRDMRVPGIPVKRIPMINHSATIALAYTTILSKM